MQKSFGFIILAIIFISIVISVLSINSNFQKIDEKKLYETEIKFQKVTKFAGISHIGRSYGSSWGYLNDDDWPDLWQGNHGWLGNGSKIFLNNKNGTFSEVKSTQDSELVFSEIITLLLG